MSCGRLSLISALLLFAALDARSQVPETSIDNFDAAKKLRHWSFSNGAEFPGASGSLSLGPGHAGRGAALAYRFKCLNPMHCGQYVAATWKAPSPIDVDPGASLSLWARFSPDLRLTVRVVDQTGQTLQFHANAFALEHLAPGEWQPVVIPVTGHAPEHWGGAGTGQLQGRMVEIAILADSRYIHPAQGRMEFDDVQLSKPVDAAFRLNRAAATITAPRGADELRSRLGVDIHFLKDNRTLDLARDAGFSFVRMDVSWAKLEKQHEFDFAPFDELMASLEARNMGVLWLLAYGHPEHGGKSPQSEQDVAAYSRYAAAVVSHFRGHNARFEIWNEPNGKQYLANPAIYPGLLRAALDAIRRQDPGAVVSTGGTSGFDFPFLVPLLQSGSAQKASAIAVHPYRDAGPETLPADLLLLRGLIQRTAQPDTPVWHTEWGYSSYGARYGLALKRQAVLAARECLTVWTLGIPAAVFYDLRDDGSDHLNREHNFGLLNQDNSGKPAMKAISLLTGIARNHKYSGLVRNVPDGVHALRLDGAEDIVFVMWNDDAGARPRMQLVRDELLSVSNMFGEPLTTEHDEVVLEETAGPVYVRVKRP